ncbi:glycosyl hydrolase family 8 [Arachidicoccus sp.]|uniref:glycosyl hydrolase family 8 n=1 Tax=Arachidicoccus sp. TaxID=1872624 RepID=UPI003D1C864D
MIIVKKISLLFGNRKICYLITCLLLLGFNIVKAQVDKGSFYTNDYPNYFLNAGYSQKDIDAKVDKAYDDLFNGPNKVYFEVGDSMAYITDLKNHDARTEGLSYGMMIAVQLNKKDVFDRIWRWSKKYLQHQDGPRKGYFAWSINPKTMKQNSPGTASDGELYFITDLLFASNRWGNNTGINYYKEARFILDNMWSKDGTSGGVFNIINTQHKQICFTPEGRNYNYTDPSYQLPAFYEVWALYAKDGHEKFYADCADTARAFLHRACSASTGLNSDLADFNGQPYGSWLHPAFRYDSWRVPMNIAMDYNWFRKDKKWQRDYAKRIQIFFKSKGIDSFKDQFNLDGSVPDQILQAGGVKELRHSLGLVATVASTEMIRKDNFDFIHALWNAKLVPYKDGYFDSYYDGLLYLFSLMHLSGNYQLIKPSLTILNRNQ